MPQLRLLMAIASLLLLIHSNAQAVACNTNLMPKSIYERIEAKDYSSAEKEAKKAIRQSDSMQANLVLAHVYINSALRSAVNLDMSQLGYQQGESGSKEINIEQLKSAMSDRYYVDEEYLVKAEKQITTVIKRWPEKKNLNYCLTKLHFYAGDHQRFLKSLHKTIISNRDNEKEVVDFLIGYSAKYFKQDRYSEAGDVCKTILITFPKSAPALSTLGISYIYQGYSSRAMKLFEKAYLTAPGDTIVIGNIGETAMLIGDVPKARTFIKKRLQLEPKRTELYFDLAILAMQKGPKNSLPAWNKYLQQHKQYPDDENWAKNAKAIQSAIEQGLDDEGLHDIAVNMINANVSKYAIPPLLYLKNKHRKNAIYTYRMAHAYDVNKNYELAKSSLEQTLVRLKYPQSELEVDIDEIHYNMSRYQYSLNELDAALKSMNKIDITTPDYADTGYMYGLIYQKSGDNKNAIMHFTRCKQGAKDPQLKKSCERQLEKL